MRRDGVGGLRRGRRGRGRFVVRRVDLLKGRLDLSGEGSGRVE